ncbi:hypothetical protein Malapachy_1797 [Malassezia pachydermatis]|uniref:Uncharacterized protein n=1 Tax=Malassezia pachydermatis TaxID=77020 RepID=A0A0M8MSQ8_9BASI|nr:hypothetical protein Malapachy_1797 [Malassezia pachydermatis]KOS13584.1 hypothetical protein Malapachy_1797 [Malassezia pachydermatis]
MAPVTKPTTVMNGQSACVQFGDCSTAPSSFKVETYNSPISPPGSHYVPNLTDKAAVSSYMSQAAGNGATVAYAKGGNQASSTPVPPPTTVNFSTKTATNGGTVVTSTIMSNAAGQTHASSWLWTIAGATGLALLSGAVLL